MSAIRPSDRKISSHMFQAVRLKVGSSPLAVESNAEPTAPLSPGGLAGHQREEAIGLPAEVEVFATCTRRPFQAPRVQTNLH